MFCYFSAVFTEFIQFELLRSFHLVFRRHIISVFTNSAGESDCNSVFAFFRHGGYYTKILGLVQLVQRSLDVCNVLWYNPRSMSERKDTVLADYSACIHCLHMGQTSHGGEVDYCNLRDGDIQDKRLDQETWLQGCSQFEWNGMPVNEDVMEEITTNSEYKTNALRTISDKPGTVSKLVFWDSVKGKGEWQSWGKLFDRSRFEISFPEEPHIEIPQK